jgi:4-diphosphocytidyl-2-C-methyl-D-erythritol kinase
VTSRRAVATAPAKINLQLGVGPVRPDGYHPLATVYHAVDLRDRVTVRPASTYSVEVTGDDGITLAGVPTDSTNIAVRAARLLADHHLLDVAVSIVIEKRIPVAGGLAGGSADAAATLVACDALWELDTPRGQLLDLGARLGSDVPFSLVGGTAEGAGRGELLSPVDVRGDYWWVLVGSTTGLSTPAVYRAFDDMVPNASQPHVSPDLLRALREHDVAALGRSLSNDLQQPALELRPDLAAVIAAGRDAGAAGVLLSGSGPTGALLCQDGAHCRGVTTALAARGFAVSATARGPAEGATLVEVA